jgi:hypothetical protein
MLSIGKSYQTFSGHSATIYAYIGNTGLEYAYMAYVQLPDGILQLKYSESGCSEMYSRDLDLVMPIGGIVDALARQLHVAKQVLRPFQPAKGLC